MSHHEAAIKTLNQIANARKLGFWRDPTWMRHAKISLKILANVRNRYPVKLP